MSDALNKVLAEQKQRNSPTPYSSFDRAQESAAKQKRGGFYHLYICKSKTCHSAPNPIPNSQHRRGVHVSSGRPLENVLCPGCRKPMAIARAPRDGEVVEGHNLKKNDPIIYATHAEPLDDKNIAAENEQLRAGTLQGNTAGAAVAEVEREVDPNAIDDDEPVSVGRAAAASVDEEEVDPNSTTEAAR